MNDRTARLLAAVSIGIALVSIAVSMYALSEMQARGAALEALSEGVQRALASQRASQVPLHGPPPALDPGDPTD
jgi:hypothetical protein